MTTPNTLTQSQTLSHRETVQLFKALNGGAVGFDPQRKTLAEMRGILHAWVAGGAQAAIIDQHAQAIIDARNAAPTIPAMPAALAQTATQAVQAAQPMPEAPASLRTEIDAARALLSAVPVQDVVQHDGQDVRAAIMAAIAASSPATPAAGTMAAAMAEDEAATIARALAETAITHPAAVTPAAPVIAQAPRATLPAGRMYARDLFQDLPRAIVDAIPAFLTVPAWPAGTFPDAEAPSKDYRYSAQTLVPALIGLGVSPAVPMLFYGAAGTGKTAMARELAARCGRPLFRINGNRHTEAADIVGDIGLTGVGTQWQDGPFAAACRVPDGAAFVLLDEPSYIPAGALACLNPLLERNGAPLRLPKTGETLTVHPTMAIVACDNTNLCGDSTGHFHARNEIGADTRERFGFKMQFDYLPAADERALLRDAIARQCGKKPTAAALAPLMKILAVSRQKSEAGELQGAPSFRGAVAFALLVAHGVQADQAYTLAIVNNAPAESHEALRQIFAAHVAQDAAGGFVSFFEAI